ncbi:transferrin-binding protein-like solute binding protein [Novosphingobium sp. SG707]|uniref:transferrin-binding protein-like solute binding protein n=1 Tax=Novosphingobium sp. SG707 TaxID=2586996 RepID=UPI001447C726|nr:transferrin-binding protein-like solute binding protein [Novosphingobium sp. SG707]NKJ00435.1 hypothetical protein [Novosphingobium sp. SG707]
MRHSFVTRALVLSPLMALAACGGDGAGVQSASSNPAPAYTKFNDLSGAQTMAASGLLYNTRTINGVFTLTVEAADPAIATANYNATTGSVSLTGPQGRASSFTSADIISQTSSATAYQKGVGTIANAPTIPAERLTVSTPNVGGVDLSYTRIGSWGIWNASYNNYQTSTGIFGVNTLASDMPRTGSANYTTTVVGSAYQNSGSFPTFRIDSATSTANFTANFGTNSVSTALNLSAFPQTGVSNGAATYSTVATPLLSMTGSGTISSSGSTFSGVMTSTTANSNLAGQFAGGFFGPQAAEMGYFFGASGTLPSGYPGFVLGTVTGRKP